jgi:hypothetical protein
MKKTNQRIIFAAICIVAMTVCAVGINPAFATGVGNSSSASFTYVKGTYTSYTNVAILYSTSNAQQTGIIKAYDDGVNLYIWTYTWAKPYLGWGEKVDSNNDGIADNGLDRNAMGSDGIAINLNGVMPSGLTGQYSWKVDSSAVKMPQIDSPSWDLNLAPGGILSGPDVYVATIPMGSTTTFNVALLVHHSPPKEPLPTPSEITTLLSSSSIKLGEPVTDKAIVSPGTTNQVTFVSAEGGAAVTGTNLKVNYPKNNQAGDLILLQIMVRDTSNAPTPPSGFTLLFGPDSSGTGQQWIYYKFSTGSETGSLSLTIAGSALKMARMYSFRNVALTSFNEDGGFGTGSTKTISAQSVTTLDSKRLAVSFIFVTDDNDVNAFTGETGGDWKEAKDQFKSGSGNDGSIDLQTATMASTGTISGGSFTMKNNASWGVRAFALVPLAIYPTGDVTFQVLPPSGSWMTYDTETLSLGSATSALYTPTSIGTYYFRAIYNGTQSADDLEPLTVSIPEPLQLTIIEVSVPPSQQNCLPTTLVTATLVDGTTSYFTTTLSNVPAGYAVTNGAYAGWCIDITHEMPRNTPIQIKLYCSIDPPTSLGDTIINRANWGAINYVLNNKASCSSMDIRCILWYFVGFYDYSNLSSGAQALVDSGIANSGFVPATGQIAAAICYPN